MVQTPLFFQEAKFLFIPAFNLLKCPTSGAFLCLKTIGENTESGKKKLDDLDTKIH